MISARIDSEGSVRLSFSYNPDYIQRIKSIPYRRYDPETRTWLIPKPQWRNFLRIFRDVQVQIPDDQTEEFSFLENPWKIPSISKVEDFKGELYSFQQKGVGFLITRKKCLLADELGVGKTIQAIAASLELRNRGLARRVLVFCPKTLVTQWMEEIYRFTGESAVAIVGNREQRRMAYELCEGKFFVITNYATVLREAEELAKLHPDVTILDEVTRIKNFRAKTTRQIKKYFRTPYRWALSGTPMENRLAELYSIMEWIDNGILGPWWIFKDKYIIIKDRYITRRGQRRRFKQVVGHRNIRELYEQLRGWMLRRRKRDVLPDLPDVTVNSYYIELSIEEQRAYSTIRRRLGELYKCYWRSNIVLAELTFLRECCDHPALIADELRAFGFDTPEIEESSKLDELLHILEDFNDRKVVIYSEWVSMLRLIAKAIANEYGIEMLHGGLSPNRRAETIHNFTHNHECKILLSSDVGQQGLNLQVTDVVINYELHWNPSRLQQRIGRLHRIGQKNTVTCINLTTVDTVEERVFKVLGEKTSLFRKIVDGDFSSMDENVVWRILEEELREGRGKNWRF